MKKRSEPIDVREEGYWYVVPHTVHDFLRDHIDTLSSSGCWLYMVLKRYAGMYTRKAEIDLAQLCLDANLSRSSIIRYLAMLEGLGLIHKSAKMGGGYLILIRKVTPESKKLDQDLPLFVEEESRKLHQQSSPCDQQSRNLDPNKEVRNVETESKPSGDEAPEPPGTKTQHTVVKEHVEAKYKAANGEKPCPWDGRTAKVLKDLLDRLRWPDPSILAAIDFRFSSEVVLSEDPIRWLPKLDLYAAGPLNQFNRPLNGNGRGSKHGNATQTSRDRLQRELEISDQLSGFSNGGTAQNR